MCWCTCARAHLQRLNGRATHTGGLRAGASEAGGTLRQRRHRLSTFADSSAQASIFGAHASLVGSSPAAATGGGGSALGARIWGSQNVHPLGDCDCAQPRLRPRRGGGEGGGFEGVSRCRVLRYHSWNGAGWVDVDFLGRGSKEAEEVRASGVGAELVQRPLRE